MTPTIKNENFINGFLALMKETFEESRGYYLDRDNSIFETLAHISAAEASIPVSAKCASIAAQVKHVNFYIEVLERYLQSGQNEAVDWGEIWRTTREVTPEAWEALKTQLHDSYQRILVLIKDWQGWDDEGVIAGTLALLAHCAYHLGEIRQATCTVQV
jgi:hypothetical protein